MVLPLRYFVLISFFWLVAISSLRAQELRSVSYQVEQGLPTNLTKAICQDKLEFTWIGTDAGLVRFDGKNFISYSRQLPSNYIKGFYQRRNGQLLVISDMGITEIDNQVDTVLFKSVVSGTTTPSDTSVFFPKELYEDKYQHLWINEANSVVRYRNRKLKRYYFPTRCISTSFQRSFAFVDDGLGGFGVCSQQGFFFLYNAKTDKFEELVLPQKIGNVGDVMNIGRGHIWLAGSNGVYELKMNEKRELISLRQLDDLRDVSYLARDNSENFYIGTWNTGLYKARIVKNKLLRTKVQALSSNVINHIYLDVNEELWVSSDDGIAYLYASFFNKLAIPQQRSYVQSALQSDNKKFYTTEGALILETTPSKGYENMNFEAEHKILYREKEGDILSLAQTEKTLWFGLSYAKLYGLENEKIAHRIDLSEYGHQIFFLKADRNKNLWVCQAGAKGIVCVTPDNKVKHYGADKGIDINVLVVRESRDGRLYFAGNTNAKGEYLFRYDPLKDRFENISVKLPPSLRANFSINDFCFDTKKIWLGTNHGLLWQFPDSLVRVNTEQEGEIKALGAATDGSIWIGTNAGIVKFQNGNFILFDESRGMPSKTISYRGIFLDKNDRVWVATANGLGYAQHINYITAITPKPILLSISVNNDRILLDSTAFYRFKHGSNIGLNFISLAYPANKTMYKYRLNTTWSAASNQTEIIFPQMGKGKYELEIKALQHGAFEWSKPMILHFNVEVPWYESSWFYGAQALVALLIVVVLSSGRRRTRRIIPITILIFFVFIIVEEYFMLKAEPLLGSILGGGASFRVVTNIILATMLYIADRGIRRSLNI